MSFTALHHTHCRITQSLPSTTLSHLPVIAPHAPSQAFSDAVSKDEHLAVATFCRGIAQFRAGFLNESLDDFTATLDLMHGASHIDYRQLGLDYRLLACEVHFNRGVVCAYLGLWDGARADLEYAASIKTERRHDTITPILDHILANGADGVDVFSLPADAIYRPSQRKVADSKKRDYMQKARVVAAYDADDTTAGFVGPRRKAELEAAQEQREEDMRLVRELEARQDVEWSNTTRALLLGKIRADRSANHDSPDYSSPYDTVLSVSPASKKEPPARPKPVARPRTVANAVSTPDAQADPPPATAAKKPAPTAAPKPVARAASVSSQSSAYSDAAPVRPAVARKPSLQATATPTASSADASPDLPPETSSTVQALRQRLAMQLSRSASAGSQEAGQTAADSTLPAPIDPPAPKPKPAVRAKPVAAPEKKVIDTAGHQLAVDTSTGVINVIATSRAQPSGMSACVHHPACVVLTMTRPAPTGWDEFDEDLSSESTHIEPSPPAVAVEDQRSSRLSPVLRSASSSVAELRERLARQLQAPLARESEPEPAPYNQAESEPWQATETGAVDDYVEPYPTSWSSGSPAPAVSSWSSTKSQPATTPAWSSEPSSSPAPAVSSWSSQAATTSAWSSEPSSSPAAAYASATTYSTWDTHDESPQASAHPNLVSYWNPDLGNGSGGSGGDASRAKTWNSSGGYAEKPPKRSSNKTPTASTWTTQDSSSVSPVYDAAEAPASVPTVSTWSSTVESPYDRAEGGGSSRGQPGKSSTWSSSAAEPSYDRVAQESAYDSAESSWNNEPPRVSTWSSSGQASGGKAKPSTWSADAPPVKASSQWSSSAPSQESEYSQAEGVERAYDRVDGSARNASSSNWSRAEPTYDRAESGGPVTSQWQAAPAAEYDYPVERTYDRAGYQPYDSVSTTSQWSSAPAAGAAPARPQRPPSATPTSSSAPAANRAAGRLVMPSPRAAVTSEAANAAYAGGQSSMRASPPSAADAEDKSPSPVGVKVGVRPLKIRVAGTRGDDIKKKLGSHAVQEAPSVEQPAASVASSKGAGAGKSMDELKARIKGQASVPAEEKPSVRAATVEASEGLEARLQAALAAQVQQVTAPAPATGGDEKIKVKCKYFDTRMVLVRRDDPYSHVLDAVRTKFSTPGLELCYKVCCC
jgi:hypothetical protein